MYRAAGFVKKCTAPCAENRPAGHGKRALTGTAQRTGRTHIGYSPARQTYALWRGTARVSYLFTLHSPLPVPFTDPRFTAAEKGIRRSGVCPLYVPFCSGRGAQARPGVSSLKGLFT